MSQAAPPAGIDSHPIGVVVNEIVAFLGWFYALIFGRMHEGMANVSAWLFRYEVQTMAYLLLLTSRYPSLAGGPTV